MTRNKIGDLLAGYDDIFSEMFEQPAEVRNYLAGGERDEYGDPTSRTEHPDNPIQTTAQVEAPSRETEGSAWGIDQAFEAEILIPDDVLLSDGDDTDSQDRDLPYGSEITIDGTTWTVVAIIPEQNGRVRCAVTED